MKVFVVIPNWDGEHMIAKCLKSLQNQTYKASIVVVDNGSTDRSIETIKSQFPEVELIELTKNTGFANGVNAGIRYALKSGADAVALFNNDAVADNDWLKYLVQAMNSDDNIGIVSCKQLRTDKKHIDSTGDFYSIWGSPFPRGRNQIDSGQYDSQEAVFSAPAGATLYRASMFDGIGLFDEKFFAYYEDVDISFRARLAGWKIIYEPSAEVYHHVSATGAKLGSFTRYHATKNFYMLYAKNMPGWLYWKYLPLFSLQAVRLFAGSVFRGGAWAYIRGTAKAFLLTPHIMLERRRIQKTRVVSIKFIDEQLYKGRPPRIPVI